MGGCVTPDAAANLSNMSMCAKDLDLVWVTHLPKLSLLSSLQSALLKTLVLLVLTAH